MLPHGEVGHYQAYLRYCHAIFSSVSGAGAAAASLTLEEPFTARAGNVGCKGTRPGSSVWCRSWCWHATPSAMKYDSKVLEWARHSSCTHHNKIYSLLGATSVHLISWGCGLRQNVLWQSQWTSPSVLADAAKLGHTSSITIKEPKERPPPQSWSRSLLPDDRTGPPKPARSPGPSGTCSGALAMPNIHLLQVKMSISMQLGDSAKLRCTYRSSMRVGLR